MSHHTSDLLPLPSSPSTTTTLVEVSHVVTATTRLISTESLRGYLFAISQYCRSVSDLTNEDKLLPTAFHSFEEPPFSLSDYIIGIGRRLRLNRLTVLLAAVYVARTAQRLGRAPSILSIHRLYAASLLLAAKVRGDAIRNDATFAASAGLPAPEVAELLQSIQSWNADSKDYQSALDTMYTRLEVARKLTLRSDIAAAVAVAFGLSVPHVAGSQTSRAVVDLPTILVQFSPTMLPTPMSPSCTDLWGSSALTSQCDPQSPRSQGSSYMVGSGMSAVRGLRSEEASPIELSIVVPTQTEVVQFALPTFEVRFESSSGAYSPLPPANLSPAPPAQPRGAFGGRPLFA